MGREVKYDLLADLWKLAEWWRGQTRTSVGTAPVTGESWVVTGGLSTKVGGEAR